MNLQAHLLLNDLLIHDHTHEGANALSPYDRFRLYDLSPRIREVVEMGIVGHRDPRASHGKLGQQMLDPN